MIRIDSTINVDPYNGQSIDTTTNREVNARHPKAAVIVKALAKIDVAVNAIAALNECDLSAPYIRDFLKAEIPTTLPFLFTEKTSPRRVDSTQSKKSKPQPAPATPQTSSITLSATANVTHNTQRDGIEVSFNAKPSTDTIAALKAKGFRWSGKQALWYCPYTHDGYAWALTLAQPTTENETTTTPTADRIDSTPATTTPTATSDESNYEVRSAYIIPTRNGWIAQPITDRIDSTPSTPPPAERIDSTPSSPPPAATRPTPAQLIAAMLAAKSKHP